MSSGASGANANGSNSIAKKASNAVASVGSSFTSLLGMGSASGAGGGNMASGASMGGSRRLRNMRGRFLSKRKAHRMTLKKRASKAATVGTKAQVFHGTAKHTSGGLTRADLMKTKKGRIVSKRKHAAGKKAIRRLRAAGFKAKKGTFKLFGRK
jgi:hypothetical protein